jgi:hypothetical protein
MTRRVALLVLTTYWSSVENLLGTLDDRFDVFVHVDLKSKSVPDPASLADHVHLLDDRVEVYWGGWSVVAATLKLLKAAMSKKPYDRYALLSGDSLPLLESGELEERLLTSKIEYIQAAKVADDPSLAGASISESVRRHRSEHPWRFQNRVFWDNLLLNPMARAYCAQRYGIDNRCVDLLRTDAQKVFDDLAAELRPSSPPFESPYVGAQWWALSADAIALIREDLFSSEVEAFFRFFAVPDEHVLPCLIGNRLDSLRDTGHSIVGTMMWTNHRARAEGRWTLTSQEIASVRRQHGQELLFARKFDPRSALDVADAIKSREYAQRILLTAK